MSLVQVNAAVVENNTIVKSDVLRAEKAGKAVKFKAVKGAKYILAEGEKGFAPENITVKRVGKDLHVFLEGTDLDQPQLIIEDFFDKPGELVGKAEDGQWHEYISTDGDSDHEAAFLMDGDTSALVLGAGTIGSLDGLAIAPFALSPALLALGALAGIIAAAGLATAIAHHRDKGSDGNGGAGQEGEIILLPVPTLKEVMDDAGEFTGPIQSGDVTDDSTPTLSGEGTPGNTIIIRDKGEIIGSTIVGEDGSWTWTPETPLEDGEHRFELVERDPAGNESAPGEEFIVIIDTDPPARPEIGQVFDDFEPKTGPLASGDWTNDNTPTFSGSGQEPGDTIIIIDNGKEVGSTIVKDDGTWEYTPTEPWKDGEHTVEVVARDPAGNRSEPSDPYDVNIDTRIPGIPGQDGTPGIDDVIDDVGTITGSISNGGITDDTTPTLEGSFQTPGSIIIVKDNGTIIGSAVADKNGGWQFTPDPELPEGDHNFTIIIETSTGYVSEESEPWLVIVDTTAPDAPVITDVIDNQGDVVGPINSGDTTDDAQPEIRGTAEAGSTVIIYDKGVEIGRTEADENGDWSFTPVPPLLNGDHELSAKAQDKAGNIGDESNKVDFDLIAGGNASAPAITGAWDDVEAKTGMLHNGDLTNDARPELRGTAQPGEIVTIIMDGKAQGSVTADANGQWSWTPDADLKDGIHNFRAEVSDAAGNKTATGNFQLEIDTQAPDAADDVTAEDNVGPIIGPIKDGDITDDSTPTFGGTGDPGDTVIIKDNDEIIGTTIVGEDGSWEFTPETPLEDGEHSVIVIIEDPAGNQSDPSDPIEFIVDPSNVIISIDYAIDDVVAHTGNMASGTLTNDDTPTLVGKATPKSLVIISDENGPIGSVQADSFGRWSFTTPALSAGSHSFTATATDPKYGIISAPTAEFVLIVDVDAPTKPGEGGTGGDGIGDIIDDVGPIQGSVGNGDVTDDTTPTLEGSGLQPGDVITIIDNGQPIGSAVADENGGWQFTPDTPLNEGDHEFTIIVTDPAGNSSEESDPYLIVVDTEAPAAPVIKQIIDDQGSVTGPIQNGGVTDDAQPEISGTAEAGSTVIIYDKGVEIGRTEADENGDWSFIPVPPLMNGDHDITAKAQDKAGNIGDESNSIGFDLIAGGNATAPAIIGAWDDVEAFTGMLDNGALTNDARPELRGTAQPGEIVTIIMDGKAQGSVVADGNGQWTWTPAVDLTDGKHNFRAEVSDAAGNKTASGNFQLEIDATPPDAAENVGAEDNVGPIVGPIENGDTTDDSTPTIGGEGEPGGTVIIKDGDDIIGSTIVGEDGHWEFTPEIPLEDGHHEIIVVIRDEAGNESDPSTPIEFDVGTGNVVISIDYAIDDVAAHTGNIASGTTTNDDTPTLVGKATPNSMVIISDANGPVGSVQADSFGRWSFTTPALQDGSYAFTATATDPKTGAVSAPTAEFALVIDTTAPTKPGEGGT
ncbi:hypothetical protein GJV09_00005, partial [Enterobacteriaceae bacterium RIT702]|nr:hypothetical protein [Enterobacteriaceae bacterium RIT702]